MCLSPGFPDAVGRNLLCMSERLQSFNIVESELQWIKTNIRAMLNGTELTTVRMNWAVRQIQKDFHHIITESVQISECVKIFINSVLVKQSTIILNIAKHSLVASVLGRSLD